jgi:hypothetical protein
MTTQVLGSFKNLTIHPKVQMPRAGGYIHASY